MDSDSGFFGVRDIRIGEITAHQIYARNMMLAAFAASLSILGLGAWFVSLFG